MESYKVLARAYRPVNFEDNFIGQETTVRVLSNAIEAGQFPHAIILSGVRGIGKTTTARILARTINCTNLKFENNKPRPCGVCESCKAILEGSCLDVVEMDAASRTSVDDIRDLIESLPYKPTLCSYKVYIIDEVHMLSKSAFNALLKTLEEPPSHIKFIFATTELHKIPTTILSRCMRFDLRGFTKEELKNHLENICTKENINIEARALEVLVEAAKGSARDALSLLDQARHLSDDSISVEQVRKMLGKADFSKLFSFFKVLLQGDLEQVFSKLPGFYQEGSSPKELARGFLELIYQLNKIRVADFSVELESFSTVEQEQLRNLAKELTTPILQSLWQVSSKGYEEVNRSPLPEAAFEMLLIRLMHAKNFFTLRGKQGNSSHVENINSLENKEPKEVSQEGAEKITEREESVLPLASIPESFEAVVDLFRNNREALLASHLVQDIYVKSYKPLYMVVKLTDHAPKNLCMQIREKLKTWTGKEWTIEEIQEEVEGETLYQQKQQKIESLKKEALENPLVKEIEKTFPGASVEKVEAVSEGT